MTRHLLATHLSPDLAEASDRVVALLRSDAPRDEKAAALDALVYRYVEAGIDEHFHDPARLFGLGPILTKVIDVAAATTLSALRAATRRILRNLTDAQLREAADEIEARLYEVEVVEVEE